MGSVEQRALSVLSREPGQQPGESAAQYAMRIAVEALREQARTQESCGDGWTKDRELANRLSAYDLRDM